MDVFWIILGPLELARLGLDVLDVVAFFQGRLEVLGVEAQKTFMNKESLSAGASSNNNLDPLSGISKPAVYQ